MVSHEQRDAIALLVREPEALEDGRRHVGTHFLVVVEREIVGFLAPLAGARLSDVVQQRGDPQRGVSLASIEALHRVFPDVVRVVAILLAPH